MSIIKEEIEKYFLGNMAMSNLDQINDWFKKSHDGNWYVKGIKEIGDYFINLNKSTPIKIIGDYDVDGVMATYMLMRLLKEEMHFNNVDFLIPLRHTEGFGLNESMIDKVESGVIITVDNGIAAIEAVKKAKNKGLTVIITDHHEPIKDEAGNIVLPEADLICDANAIPGSDFCGYCGAGNVYKLAEYVTNNNRKLLGKYQAAAAVATVADVMELKEENYVIVREGLKKLMSPYYSTTGFYSLIELLELNRHCTAHDIGFKLGPCINAMSRIYDNGATQCVKSLLYNGSLNAAAHMAKEIYDTNELRKDLTNRMEALAEQIISNNCLYDECPMVVYIPNGHIGIIGIIAGKLCERYHIPVIVFTDEDEQTIRGSGRAPKGYNLYENLCHVSDDLVKFGGHEGAAGLTCLKSKLEKFTLNLQKYNEITYYPAEDTSYHFIIDANQGSEIIDELNKYEPWGNGNPAPIFCVKSFHMLPSQTGFVRFMGTHGNIAKISSKYMDGISFNCAALLKNNSDIHDLELIGVINENFFNGKTTLQCEFCDVKFVSKNEVKRPLAEKLSQFASAR